VAASGGFGRGSRHVVPDLRGQRLDIAQAHLDAIGLDSDTRGGGTFGVVIRSHWQVCDQDPSPGSTAREVLLSVDRECEWQVPDVTGLTLKRAARELARTGTPYTVAYPPAQQPRRGARFTVCGQDPEYGPTTSSIELTVDRICALPDLTGMRLADAVAELAAAGVATAAFTDRHRRVWNGRWRVCEQDPREGEPAGRVRLTVYRTCELPDVTGMPLARALSRLTAAAVGVRVVTAFGRAVGTGAWWVCDQDPAAYEAGSQVSLTVGRNCDSTGVVTPSSASLPYLEGYGVDYARASLDAIGVFYRFVVSRTSRGLDPSLLQVCHQIPTAGEGVPDGGRAVLYVAGDCYSEWPGDFRK
jgi:beta-lactam-binding protein with PASTA domain